VNTCTVSLASSSFVPPPSFLTPCLQFTFNLDRAFGFYMWKIVALQLLITAMSWPVPFLPPELFIERANLAIALFLASVAFMFVLGESIPKVSYLTILDKMVLWNFCLLFFAVAESFVAYLIHRPEYGNSPANAHRLDFVVRFLLPPLCVGGTGFVCFYGLKQRAVGRPFKATAV
jgi:hypothetical protein